MIASSFTDAHGIAALAAGAVAIVAILWCVVLSIRLQRMRSAQRAVLGEDGRTDLVSHAASLQDGFDELQEYVSEMAATLEHRLGAVESSLAGTIAHRSLVRYDAYNEYSGQQSMSIALLDETHSGIVLSCIHHRDQARVYAKQLLDGHSERELSPEEAQAVQLALAGPAPGGDRAEPAA